MSSEAAYLRAILATVARQTFPPEQLREILLRGGAGDPQLRAYNLCDGTRSQTEIAKVVGLDSGNFSRSLGRWVDAGIVIRVTESGETRPVHVYPLPDISAKKGKSGNG